MIDDGKFPVLGVRVNAIDYEGAVRRIIDAAQHRAPLSVTALAVHGVMEGSFDDDMRARMNAFDLVCPDGQPVRWALHLLHGKKLPDRVYGPSLTLMVCAEAARLGLPIFLYGSRLEVLERLSGRLTEQFPTLHIAGALPSLFRRATPEERDARIAQIRDSGARITLVGLGCPRQEVWTYENVRDLSMPALAVGAAFDFHAGTLAQAPGALQKLGLEWLFRLGKEPRRLWKRYVLLNPKYLFYALRQALGRRDFDFNVAAPPADQHYA
jgi:exopolysaccharide biosynthesis WecB/TagA/CpsF family protein